MGEFVKTKKGKALIAVILCIAIIGVAIGCYFIFRRKLNYDYERGAKAQVIVDKAQYVPDIDKFIEANGGEELLSQSNNPIQKVEPTTASSSKISTLEEFTEMVNQYATVENYAGAGKYQGYDIHEIKNEIFYVVSKVPAFNQWFRMPTMREDEGYTSIPYYEWWAYYLEMDEENKLSITRVCWCTRSDYLDFENQKTVEDHADGTSFVQYEIMKTNYYFDENNDEVVECYIYSVGIDHVKNAGHYNDNANDYYPFEYQYLKNVKDKTLIKYHITVAERYRGDETFDEGGMDIRGLTPYGSRREFTIMNYDGYTDIDLTQIDQQFATINDPSLDGSVSFDMTEDNIKTLVSSIGLSEEEYTSVTDNKDLLDKVAKQIVDNFEIKNNWQKIYEESQNSFELGLIEGPHYGKTIPISYLHTTVDYDNHAIYFDASADVCDMSAFNLNKEYSLSMALKNRETGKIKIIGTDYDKLEKANYTSGTDYYYRVKQSGIIVNANELGLTEDGTYDIVCVLTVKNNDKDVVIFDTLEVAFLMENFNAETFIAVDAQDVEHTYTIKGFGGKLFIEVATK